MYYQFLESHVEGKTLVSLQNILFNTCTGTYLCTPKVVHFFPTNMVIPMKECANIKKFIVAYGIIYNWNTE